MIFVKKAKDLHFFSTTSWLELCKYSKMQPWFIYGPQVLINKQMEPILVQLVEIN